MWLSIAPFLLNVAVYPQPQTQGHEEYARVANLLFQRGSISEGRLVLSGRYVSPASEAAARYRKTLRDLIVETVTERLQQAGREAQVDEVVSTVRNLQGRLHERAEDLPAAVTGLRKGQKIMAVAFEILQGPTAIPEPDTNIHFYVNSSNFWYLAAEAPKDLDKLAVRIQGIESPVPGEVWILAWGKRYGDTGSRVYARVYAFDGSSVRTVWKQDALISGALKVSGDRISVTYYEPSRWRIDPPNLEEYAITPAGLNRVR